MDNKTIKDEGYESDSDSGYTENTEKKEEKPVKVRKSPPKKTVKKKKKIKYIVPKKGTRVSISIVFTVLILSVSAIAAASILFTAKEVLGIEKSSSRYVIKIPEEATLDDIINMLTTEQEEKNKEPVIKVKSLFKMLAERKELGEKFASCEHVIRPNMGYFDIIEELQTYPNVEREVVTITFQEGIRLEDAARLLEDNYVCSADMFIYYFNNGVDDYEFTNHISHSTALDLRYYRMEGFLFPDTYEFYKAYSIDSLEQEDYEIIMRKFFDNFEEKFEPAFYDRAKELGMSLEQVVTLASMIQAEAADKNDMPDVSSVFNNRLNNSDMFPKLESDPTRYYAEEVIANGNNHNLSKIMNAYNTYESAGLPPGAICNPGLDAIKAALYPNDTNNYYFCADTETKQVYYAETLEQHEINLELAGIY